ncbi:MAG: DUF2442 domain-containing protein [Sphingosinicella sp.]
MADEFDMAFEQAEAEGRRALAAEPRAVRARYDRRHSRLQLELANGCSATFPVALVEGLADAEPADLAEIELSPTGLGLHWPRLDVDLSVPGLMAGLFGTRRWMDRQRAARAGSGRSAAKAAAARRNGARGGRPRKTAASAR